MLQERKEGEVGAMGGAPLEMWALTAAKHHHREQNCSPQRKRHSNLHCMASVLN